MKFISNLSRTMRKQLALFNQARPTQKALCDTGSFIEPELA